MKEQLNALITSEDLKSITIEIVEKLLDNEISNEIIKQTPILKIIDAAKNIYTSYSDRIFLKKSLHVLLEFENIDWKQRTEFVQELNSKDSTGAEKILMAIDKLETIEKCKVFGRLCKLKALNGIDVEEFLRLTKIIQDSYLKDLASLKSFEPYSVLANSEKDFSNLISLGLVGQQLSEQEPIKRSYPFQYEGIGNEFEGGEVRVNYSLSDSGRLIYYVYDDLFEEEKTD